jgi:hypothetical protein
LMLLRGQAGASGDLFGEMRERAQLGADQG